MFHFLKNDVYTDLIIRKENDKTFQNKILDVDTNKYKDETTQDSNIRLQLTELENSDTKELSLISDLNIGYTEYQDYEVNNDIYTIKSNYIVDTVNKNEYHKIQKLILKMYNHDSSYYTEGVSEIKDKNVLISFVDYLFSHLTSLYEKVSQDLTYGIKVLFEKIINSIDIENPIQFVNEFEDNIDVFEYDGYYYFVFNYNTNGTITVENKDSININFTTLVKR